MMEVRRANNRPIVQVVIRPIEYPGKKSLVRPNDIVLSKKCRWQGKGKKIRVMYAVKEAAALD